MKKRALDQSGAVIIVIVLAILILAIVIFAFLRIQQIDNSDTSISSTSRVAT